ncbi:MAG TPA: MFS transporter [Gammaproteobacteria bacterium]|nr:MFS transporter [Gammaproteobacteria bacterium]
MLRSRQQAAKDGHAGGDKFVHSDPRDILLKSRMTAMQVIIIAITIGLNGLDGFDVLAISYASPGIRAEWHIAQDVLGLVLVAELVGMAIGSLVLGGVADKIGRRPLMLGCLVVMAIGMYMVTLTSNLVVLSTWRVITGLGIGGMLATINAVAAEFSNAKNKHLSVSIMSIGYPLVGALGGMVATQLLKNHDWRAVFYFGCATTTVFIPIVYFLVPESVHWLARKQPAGALERINRAMTKIGQPTVSALPVVSEADRKRSVMDIFRPGLVGTTVIVAAAYFFHIITFYFILKWVPDILVNTMHFPASTAGGVLTSYMLGGATGGAALGLLTIRFGIKPLTISVLVLSTVMVAIFGRTGADLGQMQLVCFIAGFFTNAGIVGLYAIFAHAYPTYVRAMGTGFAIGFGRGGSVFGPAIAGFLMKGGFGVPSTALVMALGSLLAAGVLTFLKLTPDAPEKEPAEKSSAAAPDLSGAVAHGR